jgi:oligopeptide/dipeptide ABC transporter ATP-binding protein
MREARRHLQMIFQDPYASLHPLRSVAEIVSEPWKVHRGLVPPARFGQEVATLLGQVGLPPSYARVHPASLSGGERQRVAIARAIALRPEVLILDEPVSALDVSIQAQVIKLLMQLQHDLGMAYVFISHDLPLVRLVADRVAVMYAGRVVEEGPAQSVFGQPVHPYTRLLLHASADAQGGAQSDIATTSQGCRFRFRCPKAQAICTEIEPTLTSTCAPGHLHACHFPEPTQ